MELLKFCRGCLVTDVKMYSLDITSNDSIGIMYSDLVQIQVYDSCQHVCFECASLLHKCQMFKLKCRRAHEILSQISADNILTKQMIQNIDRKANKLESSLTFSSTEICCEPFNDSSNNSVSDNVENSSHTFNDPLEISVQPTEVNIPKKEFEPDVAMKCEERSNKEMNFIKKCDVIEFSKNTLEYSSDMPTKIEMGEQNCEDFREIDVSLDTANGSLDNVDKSDLINLSVVAEKIPKVVNKLVNCKTDKRKIITNKNTKNRKRNSEIVCNTNELGTKVSRKITKRKKKDTDKNLEEYSTIVSLSAEDARNELLSRKESRVYKFSPFKCEFCYKGYGNIVAFENHMKMHSIECGQFECDICHLRFPRERCVCNHKTSCHRRKYSCKLCPRIFYNKAQAQNHVLYHKGTNVIHSCNDCGETFSKSFNLTRHIRQKHPNVSLEENVCEMCGDIFGSKGLLLHLSHVHKLEINNKEGPKCEECGVHFASETAWKRHLVVSTKHIVDNGCRFCGETFSNDPDLKSHIRINHPTFRRIPVIRKKYVIELPGACPLCKEWLSNRAIYNHHMNREHPHSEEAKKLSAKELKDSKKIKPSKATSYVCEVCGKAFKHPSVLVYHQRKHTGERPYKCDDCGKAFAMISYLNIHRTEIHLPKVPFKCDMCAKLFANKRSLTTHIKAFHLGIRPHRCRLCDKAFPHASELKVHVQFVHGIEPYPKREKRKRKRNVPKDSSP